MTIPEMSLRSLRKAIRNNEISFPSQVPIFLCQSRADIQWRLVILYFVCNWSCCRLGQRYAITSVRVRQIISSWVQRASFLGYLQEIPPVTCLSPNLLLGLPLQLHDYGTDSLHVPLSELVERL